MFESNSKFNRNDVRQRASEYEITIRSAVPHLHEELVGIAAGAGIDILDVVALNSRSEIALGEFKDGCTSLSWKVQKKNDKLVQYLSQNWDWVRPIQENLAFVEIKQDGKPTIKMVTEAGIIGKIGYNDASVGVLLNALRSSPVDTSKLPIHIILRLCLESSSAAEAVSQIERFGAASAQHILIADLHTALGLELSPIKSHYMAPNESGFLAHTNHPIENTFIKETIPFEGSKERLERTIELVKMIPAESVCTSVLRESIFSDKLNGHKAICGVEDPHKEEWIRTMTLFNIVMRFSEGEVPTAQVVFTIGPENTFDKDILDL
ncbi:hypothetical protein TWF694_010724 [Orbilia ellipsospora]|uniref:Peptidase C45 hydrolase domain-containing protein n=1 Tax=Orbilia ellipsospora TaxID=2528407 RepID=A0AAV9X843_9PEZI